MGVGLVSGSGTLDHDRAMRETTAGVLGTLSLARGISHLFSLDTMGFTSVMIVCLTEVRLKETVVASICLRL